MFVKQWAAVSTTRGAKYEPVQARVPPLVSTMCKSTTSLRPPGVDGPMIDSEAEATSASLPSLPPEHAASAIGANATKPNFEKFISAFLQYEFPLGRRTLAEAGREPVPSM